jgi:type I restriction enzyme, R subunit
MNEADACRRYVVPLLQASGRENAPFRISEQRVFTNPKSRIRIIGGKITREKPKRSNYLLLYRPDFPIAVVEAKADYRTPGLGIFGA